jgi:hypothetical protein
MDTPVRAYKIHNRVRVVTDRFSEQGVPRDSVGNVSALHADDEYEVDFIATGEVVSTRLVVTADDVESEPVHIGEIWDRFGGPKTGKVFFPDGTPYQDRSLPPSVLSEGYHRYMWVRERDEGAGSIELSQCAPAFGQPGGGFRFRTTKTAMDLLAGGYLVEITE